MSEAQQADSAAAATAGQQLTNADVQRAVERLRGQQNFVAGLIAGAVAALVGAVIWAVITDVTGYQIGFMAIGVGFIVGYAVRVAGKGIDQSFAIMGAALALLGCVVGNALAVLGIVASQEDMTYAELWSRVDLPILADLMSTTFSPMDLVFYAIAIYEGYKLSFRQVTPDELLAAARGMI
jgi:phosphate/sulfate permease